jgi:hypothetical protein
MSKEEFENTSPHDLFLDTEQMQLEMHHRWMPDQGRIERMLMIHDVLLRRALKDIEDLRTLIRERT